MDAEKTGKLIRELRTEKGLTQQELASLLKVSPTAVSKWENGRSLPDISMLEPLVKVFEVSFAEIILGERTPRATEGESAMNREETAGMTSPKERAEAAIKSVIDEQVSRNKRNTRRTTMIIAAAMLLLAAGLILLARFSIFNPNNRRSNSANRYTVIYDYEAKPADHLYIYTVENEEVREALVASYRVAGKVAALIPIHVPEHPQYKGEESRILALIRAHNTNISGAVYVDKDPKTGEIIHSGLDHDIDWKGIAGYTSPEAPMYLYYEGFQSFAVIGDRAYCLTLRGSRAIEKTDNFVPYPGGEVSDILIPGNP